MKHEYLSYHDFSWRILSLEENNNYWNETILKLMSKLLLLLCFYFFFFKIFINIDKGRIRRGGLAQFWSYEKLPVKSSGMNCPNTSDQNCRFMWLKLWHFRTKVKINQSALQVPYLASMAWCLVLGLLTGDPPAVYKVNWNGQGSNLRPIQSHLQLNFFPLRLKYLEKLQICNLFFPCFFKTKGLPVTKLLLL